MGGKVLAGTKNAWKRQSGGHVVYPQRPGQAGSENFNGYRVNTLVNEILQRIIHKAVAGHAPLSGERRGRNTHPEMAAKRRAIGA